MKLIGKLFSFVLVIVISLTSCSTKKMELVNKTEPVMQGERIKFQPVNNYFFHPDAIIPTEPLITTKSQFDSLFGAAPFMGKDGEPTKVDFSRQSVIAVVKPSSMASISLSASYVYNYGNRVVFTYNNITGDSQSYYSQPILLIAVSKSDVEGCTVELREERDASPSTLIISYDGEVGDSALMKAVKESKAELIYHYNIIKGIAIRIPKDMTMPEAIQYFKKIKGVIAVERDHINHLMDQNTNDSNIQ